MIFLSSTLERSIIRIFFFLLKTRFLNKWKPGRASSALFIQLNHCCCLWSTVQEEISSTLFQKERLSLATPSSGSGINLILPRHFRSVKAIVIFCSASEVIGGKSHSETNLYSYFFLWCLTVLQLLLLAVQGKGHENEWDWTPVQNCKSYVKARSQNF